MDPSMTPPNLTKWNDMETKRKKVTPQELKKKDGRPGRYRTADLFRVKEALSP